jgi:hypothetical protein
MPCCDLFSLIQEDKEPLADGALETLVRAVKTFACNHQTPIFRPQLMPGAPQHHLLKQASHALRTGDARGALELLMTCADHAAARGDALTLAECLLEMAVAQGVLECPKKAISLAQTALGLGGGAEFMIRAVKVYARYRYSLWDTGRIAGRFCLLRPASCVMEDPRTLLVIAASTLKAVADVSLEYLFVATFAGEEWFSCLVLSPSILGVAS